MKFYKPILLQVSFFVTMTVLPMLTGRSAYLSAVGQAQTVVVPFNEEGATLAIFVLV